MAPQPQVFGIQELYRPSEGEAEVDIVAVHGLNGGIVKTWTAQPENICWLSDPKLLPKYLPKARVLAWGYNANITSAKGRTTSSERVLQHAQTLIAQLCADRDLDNANDRPIIFLCHSLGGIVVKRALAYSASCRSHKVAHLYSIFTHTYAILFFGTPHHGSSKARLFNNFAKLATLTIPKTSMQFESSLSTALEEDSEILQNITDQFVPLMTHFCIYFFWEQEKTDLKYTKDYIVEEASAAPILDGTERCGIAADHRGMCKFKSESQQGFRTVVAALRRYMKEASEVVRKRERAEKEMMGELRRSEALELFRSIAPLEVMNIERSPKDGLGWRLLENRRVIWMIS